MMMIMHNNNEFVIIMNMKTCEGATVLHIASILGHKEIVTLLCKDKLVCIDSLNDNLNKDGNLPQHRAAFNGHIDVIKILVKTNNIDINAKDNLHGNTGIFSCTVIFL